ncbi:MAG: 16S rRNA (cytidine(1402)-2'-O)-methyltransferase [Cyanobium sp. MAG06]|nr:16S rRNA (cytidine(1402)-2'-O)-methyltransferase [Cyanobium sp. MAG06]
MIDNIHNRNIDNDFIEINNNKEQGDFGKLYIVATPIGNIDDITLRAIKILSSVSLIACENVSASSILLKRLNINTPTTLYYANSNISHQDKIVTNLLNGNNIAIISDAGTPCISDPGVMLINYIREHYPKIDIIPIPGASALSAALSVAGIIGNRFVFLGFPPNKKGRETFFKSINDYLASDISVVFYESVHRIEKAFEQIRVNLGENMIKNKLFIGREMTKIYEEYITGDIEYIIDYYNKNKDKIRGEFVVIIKSK